MGDGFAEGLAVGQNNGNNANAWGGEWIWIIVLFALFGWGGNGYGNQGRGQVGGQEVGYELGKLATTNDVASGFANSASLASLNDLKLGQLIYERLRVCFGLLHLIHYLLHLRVYRHRHSAGHHTGHLYLPP